MLTLAMDTSAKNLVLMLAEDHKMIDGICKECNKRQSEDIFPELKALLDKNGKKLEDVDEVVITEGPGSYTGLRIAMTIAKLLATQSNAALKAINTLQLAAGTAPSANVLMDARGKRAYVSHVENGNSTWLGILPVDQIEAFLKDHPGKLYGDAFLIDQDSEPIDWLANFEALLPLARTIEHPHDFTPLYLKENEDYLV